MCAINTLFLHALRLKIKKVENTQTNNYRHLTIKC